MGGAGDCALESFGVTTLQVLCLGWATDYAFYIVWGHWLGSGLSEIPSCIQQSGTATGWALVLGGVVGYAPRLGGILG